MTKEKTTKTTKKEKKILSIMRRIPLERFGYADVPIAIYESTFFDTEKLEEVWLKVEQSVQTMRNAHTEVLGEIHKVERERRQNEQTERENESKIKKDEEFEQWANDNSEAILQKRQEFDLDPQMITDVSVARMCLKDIEKAKPIIAKSKKATNVVKIDTLQVGDEKIIFEGKVCYVGDITTFTRKDDGTEGQRATFKVDDNTAAITIPLWGNKTKYVNEFVIGDKVRVRGYRRTIFQH